MVGCQLHTKQRHVALIPTEGEDDGVHAKMTHKKRPMTERS